MGLQDTISTGVAAAFSATEDLAKDVTVTLPSSFDDVTEAETPGGSDTFTVRVAQYSTMEVDGVNIQAGDLKALAMASEMTVVPKIGSSLSMDGETWHVRNLTDIAKLGLVYILQLRRAQ